jgi:tetratricopeptide (TPR) repeat protein
MLGAAYAELRRYDMAEEEFKTILKKDELFLNAYLNLGRVYEMKGEYKKALAEYFRYLMHTSEPLDAAVGYIRIGDLYRKMGSKEKALSYYRKADGFCGVGFNETRKLIRERVGSL